MRTTTRVTLATALSVVVLVSGGCGTATGAGAVRGAGLGALIGGAAVGGSKAIVIGASVGTGIGYVIGDDVDRRKAQDLTDRNNPHPEVAPLGGTRWALVSLTTDELFKPYDNKVIAFRNDGWATTTTELDGGVTNYDERYRVVGSTLILRKPGCLVNARFNIDGDDWS